jgi:all-trans-retinol 13,14-reductase
VTIIGFPSRETARAWPGGGVWPRPAGYVEFKRREAAAIAGEILARCPELKGDLEVLDSATDLTLSRYCFARSGGLYGRLHGPGEAPIWPVTRVKNLALAGQDVMLPGLLGVLVSSALAVDALVGPEALREVWEV